jgi:hypothetical protein
MRTALWEPDSLLASQYAALHESRERSPERRLVLAVLKSALDDYVDALCSRRRDEVFELADWFFEGDDSWPFSFENLCAQLDLNPECIRASLAALENGYGAVRRRVP